MDKKKSELTKNKIQITFKLHALSVDYFNIIDPKEAWKKDGINLSQNPNLLTNFQTVGNLGFNLSKNIVQVLFTVTLTTPHNTKPYFLCEIRMAYDFQVENLAQYVNKENQLDFPENLLITFNSVAISTTRGILFSKLSGTFLSGTILPLISLQDFQKITK